MLVFVLRVLLIVLFVKTLHKESIVVHCVEFGAHLT